ncbi:MAG TPA: DUF5703 domain-containing protein [Candidatus Paceibacterota bacterium]|nr:DUF5703 domain-containing protein [Candidatus Paceibacterota bacterium]
MKAFNRHHIARVSILGIMELVIFQAFDLSAAAVAAATPAVFVPLAELDRYNVVWNSPGLDASGSMPIGNGEVGLNVWVEANGDLVFYISRTDAWSECNRLLKLGRVRVHLSPNPFAAGQPFRQELIKGSVPMPAPAVAARPRCPFGNVPLAQALAWVTKPSKPALKSSTVPSSIWCATS